MYYTLQMPTVTAASSTPAVGGKYSPLVMYPTTGGGAASAFSVLGQLAGGALPSFQTGGVQLVHAAETPVGQAGTVTKAGLPGKIYNPAAAMACDKSATNADPNWRFSQNVAGLTKLVTTKTNLTKTLAKSTSVYTSTGARTVTWADPALVAPASPGGAYFDQNAGVMSLTRNIQLGSEAAPNIDTSTLTVLGQPTKAEVINASYTSAPFVDVLTRDLLDGSWRWNTRTVQRGTVVTSHAIQTFAALASATTTFAGIVWKYNSDPETACLPEAGTVTTVITPVDTTKQETTLTVKFGRSTGITAADGVTVTVACSGGAAGAANCTAVPEADDADYRPTGCNF
jgi:hypothetical protein